MEMSETSPPRALAISVMKYTELLHLEVLHIEQ